MTAPHTRTTPGLDRLAVALLLGFVASLQLSIALAHVLLAATLVAWAAMLVRDRIRPAAPAFFLPLLAYAGMTLVASAFSIDPLTSLVDSKQLLLFAIVPAVYDLARGPRAATVVDVIVTVGAASAAFGIIQYGMLHYDSLRLRPQGALTHYMTYSGVLMLVICAATARLVFGSRDRVWPALVMPALVVALALTLSRNAWVGACVAVGLLLVLKDFRLSALLPVVVAVMFAMAPDGITSRMMSMFDVQDPSNQDRLAMVEVGTRIIASDPLTGVGPNMVPRVYEEYRSGLRDQPDQSAPAQRAAADCGRARPAGAGRSGSGSSWRCRSGVVPAVPPGSRARARRHGARRGGGDARGRPLRVQLRRFRVPDALPRARHAAVRGDRGPMLLPPIGPDRGRRIASSFAGAHVLVVGDAMLDRFIVGRVTRISPEAPVPVVTFDHETHRIGGAANVAHNVTALGGEATLIAVTGQDDTAATLARACHEAGNRAVVHRRRRAADDDEGADRDGAEAPGRAHRLRGGRRDRRRHRGPRRDRRAAAGRARLGHRHLGLPEGVDHAARRAGGDCRGGRQRRAGARRSEDPAPRVLRRRRRRDAESSRSGDRDHMRVRTDEEARAAARVFRERAGCERGADDAGRSGHVAARRDVEGQLPAAAREVADVTGAGDTVIATLALATGRRRDARRGGAAGQRSRGHLGRKIRTWLPVSPIELLVALGAAANI